MTVTKDIKTCVSKKGIEYHYDLSNEFYKLFLDKYMMYSCGLWKSGDETLDQAQDQKIEYHMKEGKVEGAKRILDVGCGWGSILVRATDKYGVEQADGVTLATEQYNYVKELNNPRINVYLESWQDYQPTTLYDAIITIGAFPHFARPELTRGQKIAGYRKFFEKCHQWLKPGGHLILETMIHGYIRPEEGSNFFESQIFPESELATLSEIVCACEDIFEVLKLRNDLKAYERTNELWRQRLKRNRVEVEKLVGLENYKRYEKYFGFMSIAYFKRRLNLVRMTMRRIDK